MSKTKPVQTFAPPHPKPNIVPPLPWAGDEHSGSGGRYVFDPVTQTRTRVEEPQSAEPPSVITTEGE